MKPRTPADLKDEQALRKLLDQHDRVIQALAAVAEISATATTAEVRDAVIALQQAARN